MSRADDLGEEGLQRRHHPGLERAHQARRPAASSISSRARPRLASGPATATSTRSSVPGAASTRAGLAAQVDERRRPHARAAAGGASQPPDQAGRERRDGPAVDAVHELLGHDQPVGGRDEQRSPHARAPG